jgi:subtilisin-like proprotein convertase family protein
MKKLGIFVAGLALVLAAQGAMAANLVVDPGFEGGAFGGFWTESSTNFGTPLCDTGSCGFGGGTGPNSGLWWAWFGGIGAYEAGLVSQPIVIPVGANTLTFYYENPVFDTAADYVEAVIDGTAVWTAVGDGSVFPYAQQVVDITPFADGGAHTLEFRSEIFANAGTGSNFFIDDVEIDDAVAPAGTGACCTVDTCVIATEADCDGQGGFYQGDDTACVADSGATEDHVSQPGTPIDSLLPPAVDVIVVANSFAIADLDIDFVATHSWVGDLEITIEGPDGTVVVLQDNVCGNVDNEDVIFDDEGGALTCGSPVTGGQPLNALSAFDGKDSAGPWTITVTDTVGGDTGTLDQWSLHFDIGESTCAGDGACCTNGAGVSSDCIETSQDDCEADGGLFVGGSCDDVVDCLPLFVEFESVEAVQTADGVAVRWTTSLESDTVGFQVYKQIGREKAMVKVGRRVLAAGVGTVGASYEVLDAGAKASDGAVYFIGDIDINGRETVNGPFNVTGPRVRPAGRVR